MSTRAQCADAEGVCPDSTREPTSNDITDVSGDFMQNITMVQYTRPLAAADATLDRSIETTGPSFVSWAMGPLNPSLRLPLFHDGPIAFPREDVSIEFGREVSNACIDGFQEEEPKPDVPGFEREPLVNVTEITARIGPSGGARGYGTLTGGPAWGIAWYLSPTGSTGEDTLIPVLAVERGKTYKFTVYGGVDDETDRTFHPFYITDSPAGGYGAKTPAQRAAEKVYAGIDRIRNDEDGGVVSFRAPATGALCEIEGSNSGTEKIVSFPRYYSTLNTSCVDDAEITSAGGTLEWTVAADTPDMVYYQCVTHQYLGFKVLVFDEGEVDEKKLREASGGGPLIGSDGEPVPTCDLKFKGKTVSYDGCRKDLEEDVEVYWTIREDDGEIDTLFRAPNTTGYVGLGWGYSQMVEDDGGSNAVIMYRGAGGRAEIMDYALSARSTAGVQPSNNQNITNEDAEFADGYISGMFTRKLEMDGIPTITKGETNVIYALGSRPESATSLTRHSSRFLAMVDLNETTSNFVLPGATPAPLAQPDEAAQCFATFKGENKTYGGCQMGLEGEVDVFWTIREDDGEIDTLFRGRTNGGYVGWAWGYERMVQDGGSNSVIAYRGPSGNAEISDYQMSARTPSGVQPNDNQGLSSMDAEIDGDMVVGVFTRKMVVAGLPPLAVGKVKALWAVGSRPDSATTLVQHTSRTAGEIDLSIAGTGGTVTTVNSTATIFKVHGAFMGLSWFLFAPIAVIFMAYFKKFNPVTFQVHRALNGTVVLLTIAGYIMAVSRGSHTETAHLVIGTIVLALALLQALGGLLRPGIGSKKRSVWYLLHACSGGVLAILAASNAFLGIDIIGGGTGWFVACGVVWGLLVVVYVVLGLFPRKFPRKTPVPVPADGDRDDVEAKGAHETVAEPDTELSI